MRKKFLIMAPPYSENDGGGIVLHKLCDELNRLGCDAYLIPMGVNFEFDFNHFSKSILKIAGGLSRYFKKLTLNPIFKTPVMALADVKKLNLDDWLVVYPETVFGNPVQARHVVRWFLHHPGFHTGKIFFGTNELYCQQRNKDFEQSVNQQQQYTSNNLCDSGGSVKLSCEFYEV